MLASSSTLEGLRASPSPRPGFPGKRISSSPLAHSHTAGSFISPSMDSLVADPSQTGPNAKPRRKALSWNLPWRSQRNSTISTTGLIPSPAEIEKAASNPMKTPWHHGWKTALFGTYFNIFLLLIPASIALHSSVREADSIVFLFCILSLIPLIRLHDLATASLARRIGGSKAGLLNASLSNIVEMVIAFIALRKCELRVVQSSLIGSMMCKSLLVFGLCTFAGGLRWKEQWFNSAAIQVQSSLLSISVSAVLLPAVFHFAIRDQDDPLGMSADLVPTLNINSQKTAILRMSHGVAVTLLLVYVAYLTFQLWSHSHLYEDSAAGIHSRGYSKKSGKNIKGKEIGSPVLQPGILPPTDRDFPERPSRRSESPSSFPRPLSSALDQSNVDSLRELSSQTTVRLVHPIPRRAGSTGIPMQRTETAESDRSEVTLAEGEEHPNPFGQETTPEGDDDQEVYVPQLSWFMTVFILAVVSVVVAITADWLVVTANEISVTKYISKEWTALILLPTVRAIADCVTAINVSVKDQLTLSSAVAIGSTIQLSLFVIPLICIVAWITGYPLGMLFDPFESVALYLAIHTMNYVVADGRSNWMEGTILICFYVIIAIAFWFYPGSNLASDLDVCP